MSEAADSDVVQALIAQFVRSVVAADAAFAVAGDLGLAQVPSPRGDGVAVDLVWPEAQQALKWADVLVSRPELIRLDVDTMIETYLPGLAEAGGRVGVAWSDGPSEPEMAALDLLAMLLRGRVEAFATRVAADRQVWLLRDPASGEVTFPHPTLESRVMPVFSARDRALVAADAAWPEALAVRQASGEFLGRTVLSAISERCLFCARLSAGGATANFETARAQKPACRLPGPAPGCLNQSFTLFAQGRVCHRRCAC